MFIVSLTYIVPLCEVDAELNNHIEYLKKQYAKDYFCASGAKTPRTSGGVIFSMLSDKDLLESILDQDPFKIKGLANYDIIEFTPSFTSDELSCLKK